MNSLLSTGKCYCLLMQRYVSNVMEEVTKAKGVDFSAQQSLTCTDYENALFHNQKVYKQFQRIRSKNYVLETVTTNKLALR